MADSPLPTQKLPFAEIRLNCLLMTLAGLIKRTLIPAQPIDCHSATEFDMSFLKVFVASACMFLILSVAHSQEVQNHALADTEVSYTYQDGGAVTLTVSGGKLGYLWTAGPFEGTEVRDLDYYSKRLGESLYFVSWHDPDNKNFVTLIFDFDQMIEYGTALIGYETDMEVTLFDEARIDSVRRL